MPCKDKKKYNAYMKKYNQEYRLNLKTILNELRKQGKIDTGIRRKRKR